MPELAYYQRHIEQFHDLWESDQPQQWQQAADFFLDYAQLDHSFYVRGHAAQKARSLGRFVDAAPAYEACILERGTEQGRFGGHWHSSKWWRRSQSLAGRRLAVLHDGGLGDALMAVRYIPLLEQQEAQVLWELPQPLMPWLSWQFPRQLFAWRQEPEHDLWITATCLLGRLIPAFSHICAQPYLRARASDQPLALTPGFALGLCAVANHNLNSPRSFDPIAFAPLLQPSVQAVCLEHQPFERNRLFYEKHQVLMPSLNHFGDTAAVLSQLDLVISADTAVAHAAAALGIPTWVLQCPDSWSCWGRVVGPVSPWHQAARLFHATGDDWSEPIKAITTAFSALLQVEQKGR